jgi:RNase P/RNase MRP subunit POP5
MIRAAIDVIHGKIGKSNFRRESYYLNSSVVDTRAAHLDRSRTKAALQRLSMRVYYQRLATSKLGVRGGTRKIREFFAPSS